MMVLIFGLGIFTTLSLALHEEVIQFNIESLFLSGIQVATVIILAYSANKISKSIKAINITLPNERFTNIHIVNSIIYTILFTALGVCLQGFHRIITDPNGNIRLLITVNTIQEVMKLFGTWLDLFLLYLILRFTKPD